MRRRLIALAVAVCVARLAAGPASAEPATPEGAKAIGATYAAYFGAAVIDKGFVTITPQGDDYVVSWDMKKAIAAMGGAAKDVQVGPLVYRITPTLDGGWLARASSLPSLTLPPTPEGKGGTVAFEGFRFDGLYDATASDFWRAKIGLGALKLDATANSGEARQRIMLSEDGVAGELRIKAGEDADSVDVRVAQSIASARQKTAVGEGDAAAPASETRQGAASGDSLVTGLRAQAFADLWRYLVARGDSALSPADELRPKLVALLPLWSELAAGARVEDVAVSFPGGAIGVKSVGEELSMTGLVERASAALALAVEDLTVEFEGAPEWLKTLSPTSFAFQVEARAGGVDRVAQLALADPEFLKSGNLSADVTAQILQTLRAGQPQVAIKQTHLVTPLGDATLEGEATFGDGPPQAHAKVTANDLDKTLEALAKIIETEPGAQQLLYLATFARGLAQTEDGRLVWNIEYVAPHDIRVNGQVLSGN